MRDRTLRTTLMGLAAAGALVALVYLAATPTQAAAIIDNGVVQLGVDDLGQLNIPGPVSSGGTPYVGLRYMATNGESTSPGCLCEGWGLSMDGGATWGGANNAFFPSTGGGTISLVSFTSPTPDTAISVVRIGDLKVTHDYHPSPATLNLYEVAVTIENVGLSAHSDITYRRAMDWDVEPTPFSEYSTIDFTGAAAPPELIRSTADGFASPNPNVPPSGGFVVGPPTMPAGFIDAGPADHGAQFDFYFGTLGSGDKYEFTTFYGAAKSEAAADAARVAAGVQLWSYGQCNKALNPSCDEVVGSPNTFIFGFGRLTPTECEVAKTGRAFIAHLHHEDVGSTGYVGPGDGWVVDSGDVWTNDSIVQEHVTGHYTGPLMHGEVLFARVVTQSCESTARAAVLDLEGGPMLPAALSPFRMKVAEVTSTTSCKGSSGGTTIAYLMVGGTVIIDTTNMPPPNTRVDIGPVHLILNEHKYTSGPGMAELEVNAVRATIDGVADLRILSARSDIHGCTVPPPVCEDELIIDLEGGIRIKSCKPPCTAGDNITDCLPCPPKEILECLPCHDDSPREVGGDVATPGTARGPVICDPCTALPDLGGVGTIDDVAMPGPIRSPLICDPCIPLPPLDGVGTIGDVAMPGAISGPATCDPCTVLPHLGGVGTIIGDPVALPAGLVPACCTPTSSLDLVATPESLAARLLAKCHPCVIEVSGTVGPPTTARQTVDCPPPCPPEVSSELCECLKDARTCTPCIDCVCPPSLATCGCLENPDACVICINCIELPPAVRDLVDGICINCSMILEDDNVEAAPPNVHAAVVAVLASVMHSFG